MGRGILTMKLIDNHKSRNNTFFKRKKSLMRKAYELSTLCDVRTCVIVYGPTQKHRSPAELHTWPSNGDEIENMIGVYKTKILEKRQKNVFNLCDFFSDREKKIEAEISKLRKQVADIKFPTWDDRLENLSEDQLRFLIQELDSKIDAAKRKIEFLNSDGDRGMSVMSDSSSLALTAYLEPESFFQEHIQWPFHQYQMENSVPIMPMQEQDMDLFQFISGFNGHQIENNALNNSIMPLYTDQMAFASDYSHSQMMNSGFGEVNEQVDYINYEFLMKNNYF